MHFYGESPVLLPQWLNYQVSLDTAISNFAQKAPGQFATLPQWSVGPGHPPYFQSFLLGLPNELLRLSPQ